MNRWGDRGVLTLDYVLNLKPRVLAPVMATGTVLALAAIHAFVDRRLKGERAWYL